MPDIVRVNWSGGKDSTCAVLMHLELGHTVKAVCYIPMFDSEIPLITKAHYNFLHYAADKFREMGATVTFVHGMSYVDYCTHRAGIGKYRGLMFGYPSINRGQCGFKRDSKIKACNTVDIGYYDYQDIGIWKNVNSAEKKRTNCTSASNVDDMCVQVAAVNRSCVMSAWSVSLKKKYFKAVCYVKKT